ncbi:hypothetical protein FA10DRAFT_269178 [Acaromyces ingoldii]|uniref:Uncharacterized protein n=1 Tax=Acaromyces ingoldii TaxID=215250 RepID=A0A316YEQ1_9BASI|nr:hypothetical protein FA10DRAFT_269178 [Acaromyces ingoldii]PWN87897.1 hypothetical protein FA10DRAFT_269178 [Acaromyces ingoldii]
MHPSWRSSLSNHKWPAEALAPFDREEQGGHGPPLLCFSSLVCVVGGVFIVGLLCGAETP